jgi:predicted DNA-binding protein
MTKFLLDLETEERKERLKVLAGMDDRSMAYYLRRLIDLAWQVEKKADKDLSIDMEQTK